MGARTRFQTVVIFSGLCASIFGIAKLSAETVTMILPAWMLIGVVVVAVGAISLVAGFILRSFLSPAWHTLTYSSMILILAVGIYAVADHRPTIRIVVPAAYTGQVILLYSRDTVQAREIDVNRSGIGYITEKADLKGFAPRIIQRRRDIGGKISHWARGDAAGTTVSGVSYSMHYVSLTIPGPANDPLANVDRLIREGGIDTTRLQKGRP